MSWKTKFLLVALTAFAASELRTEETRLRLTAPPADWKLDPFYKKHVSVNGFPVVGSAKVSDYAVLEAAYLIEKMLAKRPDILAALVKNKVRCAVMAYSERTTDIPEHSDLKDPAYWNRRARGLGPTRIRPAVSCAEENLQIAVFRNIRGPLRIGHDGTANLV